VANRLFNDNAIKLGTFAQNGNGGNMTALPNKYYVTWPRTLHAAQLADAAGFEALVPYARWKSTASIDAPLEKHGVLEPYTWAAGIGQGTQHAAVFSTSHVPVMHPIVAAKQSVTVDHITNGRFALNIVAGWNKPEYEALGLTLPDDHETRYGYAQEWFDIVEALWDRTESFDWNGHYFRLKNVLGDPRPSTSLPILNAAGSEQGRKFAVRNADFLFTPAIDLARSKEEVAALKKQAADAGRAVDVLTFAHVVCRPTEKEATAYLEHFGRVHADWDAVDNLVRLQFAHAQSFPHDLLALIRDRMAAGHGGYPLTGTPEQVAQGIIALHDAGFRGTTLSFVDYAEEFPYFRDTVLPMLEAHGIRSAPRVSEAAA
jgi:dimethylsulfone monooxygenase